jgi:hypothetical protein
VTPGLLLFLAVGVADLTGLAIDLMLRIVGNEMITEIAWRKRSVAFIILALQLVGVAGLALHFFPIDAVWS